MTVQNKISLLMELSGDLDRAVMTLTDTDDILSQLDASIRPQAIAYYRQKIAYTLQRIELTKSAMREASGTATSATRSLPENFVSRMKGPVLLAMEFATRGAIATVEALDYETQAFLKTIHSGYAPTLVPGVMSGSHMALLGAALTALGKLH